MAKNPAAVELGRRGGKARLKKMTPEQRKEVARNAVNTRWAKFKEMQRELKDIQRSTRRVVKQGERLLKKAKEK